MRISANSLIYYLLFLQVLHNKNRCWFASRELLMWSGSSRKFTQLQHKPSANVKINKADIWQQKHCQSVRVCVCVSLAHCPIYLTLVCAHTARCFQGISLCRRLRFVLFDVTGLESKQKLTWNLLKLGTEDRHSDCHQSMTIGVWMWATRKYEKHFYILHWKVIRGIPEIDNSSLKIVDKPIKSCFHHNKWCRNCAVLGTMITCGAWVNWWSLNLDPSFRCSSVTAQREQL